MSSKLIKMVLVVVLALALCGVALAGALAKKPVVRAEPLACFSMDEKVVCFDGSPCGEQLCQNLDADTVLCTSAH